MLENYEINKSTLALIPIEKNKTIVHELETEFIVNQTPFEIINESCKYFGSSYYGRFEGTKKMVGYNYKSPIIIEETNRIIFFPTSSPRLNNCAWISLKYVKDYYKNNNESIIIFTNNLNLNLNISYNILENQILRATKLLCTLDKICEKMN